MHTVAHHTECTATKQTHTYRRATTALTEFAAMLAFVVAVPATLWALAHPVVAVLAVLAAVTVVHAAKHALALAARARLVKVTVAVAQRR